VQDFDGDAGAVGDTAAAFIAAAAGVRGEELAEQVAVGEVDLYAVHLALGCAFGCGGEVGDDLFDPVVCERFEFGAHQRFAYVGR
jgi:hypothetical protein